MNRRLELHAEIERWELVSPFHISGYSWTSVDLVQVRLRCGDHVGCSEAAGIYYKGDRPESMLAEIGQVKADIEAGLSRAELQRLLPPGGSRNALDCAMWDLEARLTGTPVWVTAALPEPAPLLTTMTCGADRPEVMAREAERHAQAKAVKLKLTGDPEDVDRVRSVREARPDVWLSVDANQGFTRPFLEKILPDLVKYRVAMIEQPFAVGAEHLLDGFRSPIPIVADESIQSLRDLAAMPGRFDGINIKLDKCGGLTEGLELARAAEQLGLSVMIGNMMGTSLAMAPAFLLGQLCSVVDLDGPIFLKRDRRDPITYEDGKASCPQALWGWPASTSDA